MGVSLLATLTKLGYKILIVLAFVAQEDPASMLQFAACSDARKESWIFTKIGGPFHCPGRGDTEIHYFLCASECDIGGRRFPFASRNPFFRIRQLEWFLWMIPLRMVDIVVQIMMVRPPGNTQSYWLQFRRPSAVSQPIQVEVWILDVAAGRWWNNFGAETGSPPG